MLIYNVTVNIEESIHNEWLQWMKTEHIPDMLATKKFSSALMSRVLVEEEMGGVTYSIQYKTKNKELLQSYYNEDAKQLNTKSTRFAGKFVAFTTELEIISEHS